MRSLGGGRVECLGQILRSNTPSFSMARRLIEQGFPPDAEATMLAANGTPSLCGQLGAFAGLAVVESDTRGPSLVRYRKNCFREAAGRSQDAGRTSPTRQAATPLQHATHDVEMPL